eukprot:PhF_6_TR1446/c0_g1_i1/m.2571
MEFAARPLFRDVLRILPDNIANRKTVNLRSPCQIAVTIDPMHPQWIHVHVPDVASYIPHGSAYEIQAQQRSHSMYLPETSVTMLPPQVEQSINFPLLNGAMFTITYSAMISESGEIIDFRVAPSMVEGITVLTYSQVESTRAPHPTWRVLRDMCASLLISRAQRGAAVIDFDDLVCIETQGSTIPISQEVLLKDGLNALEKLFPVTPVRVAQSRNHTCVGHYVVRELEILANCVALMFAQQTGTLPLLTQRPQELNVDTKDSLFSTNNNVVSFSVPECTKGDVFTMICDALRQPESHAQLLRSWYPHKGLGVSILSATNPLGSHAEIYTQYVLHSVFQRTPWRGPRETDFKLLRAHHATIGSRVVALLAARRSVLITRWVHQNLQQSPTKATNNNINAIRRIKAVTIQRTIDRTTFLVPLLGVVVEVQGGARVWGWEDTSMVPLPELCCDNGSTSRAGSLGGSKSSSVTSSPAPENAVRAA